MGKPVKSALEIIFEWSQDRALWQRDALRRIIVSGSLTEADIADLVALCKKEHGDAAVPITAAALTADDLPASPGAGESISVTSIAGVEGVNQLAAGQDLRFEAKGLTIVYGDNGAGKSGYARVLKRACRARFPGEIMPDAYDQDSPRVATATIGYRRGETDKPPLQWHDDGRPHAVLSAVSVFDRDCATIHVREKNEVAFRPFGLDIPDDLAEACQRVKAALSANQAVLESARDSIFAKPSWTPATAVGKIMSSLSAATKPADLERLASVSEGERERHRRLLEDLAKDPKKASSEQTLYADQLRALGALVVEAAALASDGALNEIQELAIAATARRRAATMAASGAFGASLLPGGGEEAWRSLWEAARRYASEVAYVATDFPPRNAPSLCVLCQQPLSVEALTRLAGFEAFVQSDVEQQAQQAECEFADALREYDRGKITTKGTVRRQISLSDPALGREILRFLATARHRRMTCRRAFARGERCDLRPLPKGVEDKIRALEATTRMYAKELLNAANLEVRKRLESERDELGDRIGLETLLDQAKTEIERLKSLNLIARCLEDTNTTAVTRLGNMIADEVITPKIRDCFQKEIVRLADDRVRVEIVRAGGKYGSPVYQVRLFANKDAPVHSVLSEGEQTCVALAAFLTELTTASHHSALVFDDPVSSLDHRWRLKVAQRLVDEAAVRQIIVFTHDIVFVNDLNDSAEGDKVPVKLVSLSRTQAGAGVVALGLPWKAAGIKDRIDKLEKDAREARKLYEERDDAKYREAVYRIYSNLRSTWERAIEDIAFHGVICRHRDYVNTKYLRKTTVLDGNDCDAFEKGFQKCCDLTDAHDGSRGRNAGPPPPDEVLKDIRAVRTWADSIRGRQKEIA